jgi:uncharacterized protein involved in exopolysaccharide biosynthesis
VNEATPQTTREPAVDYRPERAQRAAVAREVTISGMAQTLWGGLWLIVAAIVLAVLVTALALKLRSPDYTATMIVAPAQADLSAASQLASELEQFASLATLAQTPAKIERVSELERYIQLFGSTTLAARVETEHHLLQTVYADYWDPERQAWRPPTGIVAALEGAVLGFFGFPAWTEPDDAQLAEWLGNQVEVARLGGSSLLRIQMSHPKPAFARSVIEMVHDTADRILREQSLARIGVQIAQVESELEKATTPTRKGALEEVLVEQYQAQALLRANQPYAAQVVVPAMASAFPSSPSPFLILALAAVVGAILGMFVVFLRDALR